MFGMIKITPVAVFRYSGATNVFADMFLRQKVCQLATDHILVLTLAVFQKDYARFYALRPLGELWPERFAPDK
jgi:hypothetical protein